MTYHICTKSKPPHSIATAPTRDEAEALREQLQAQWDQARAAENKPQVVLVILTEDELT